MDIYNGEQKTYDAAKTTAIRIHREQRSFVPGSAPRRVRSATIGSTSVGCPAAKSRDIDDVTPRPRYHCPCPSTPDGQLAG